MIDRFLGTGVEYDSYVALKRRVWPHESVSPSSQREADARRDPAEFNERLLVRQEGAVVAAADIYSLRFSADADRFGFMVIVDPSVRRRGIGTALYTHIIDRLDLGRVSGWETAAWEGEPSGSAWLDHIGFRLVSTHQMSELNLDSADTAPFQKLIDDVEATGVAIKSFAEFTNATLDAAHELYDLAVELSRDAPWYEDVAKPPLEVWRREFIDSDAILADAYTVAVEDGQLVGQSALMKDDHDPTILRTGLTGVRKQYRRRHIATAMKMRAIDRAVQRSKPEGGLRIVTGNAAENPMLELNLRLGFEKQPAWCIYVEDDHA